MFKPFHVEATSIADAWFQIIYNIIDNSYKTGIQHGSFEGNTRFQFPSLSVFISGPNEDMVPVMPPDLAYLAPTTQDYIEDYFVNYLMDPALGENETYKYASRIHGILPRQNGVYEAYTGSYVGDKQFDQAGETQFQRVVRMLKETPQTNQAIIEVGSPADLAICWGNDGKLDPPCLRVIDFKAIPIQESDSPYIVHHMLTMSVYFRSWDLWGGMPTNLGGLELLKQHVAHECGLLNGPIYAYSAGAHVYGHHQDMVNLRTRRK